MLSRIKIARCFFVAGIFTHVHTVAGANDTHDANDVMGLSLEQLLAAKVTSASKYEQKQSEVAASVYVITREEIKTFGWRTIDEALASLPGLYTTFDYQSTYFGARGFAIPGDFNTRVLILINGNRFNDPVYDGGPLGMQFPLDMDLIERIEFIPGPGGAVYGQNAMFGVVNVITRTGATVDGTELSASYQTLQQQVGGRVSWGKLFDSGMGVLLSVSGADARGHDLFLAFPGSGVAPGVVSGLDGSRDKTFFGRLMKGPWSLEHVYGDFFRNDPTATYRSDPFVPGQFQEDSYSLTQLKYQDSFANGTLQVSGRLFNGEYRYRSHLSYSGMPFSYPANGDWYGGELQLLSTAVRDHKLMVGMEVQQNTHADQFSLDLTDPANNIVIPGSSLRYGIYAQDEWRISDTLTSTLGLRVDRDYIIGTRLSPRIGLIWQAMPATTVKALYGRAHRAPNVFEHAYTDNVAQVNNPGLKGESVNTMELVADHLIGRNLTLHGSIYQWTFSGLISLGTDPVTNLAQYQNGKAIEAHGVEVSADNMWDWGGRLRGSMSYQNVRQEDHPFVPNSPQLMTKLNFSTPLASSGLLMGYELQYYSERKAIDGVSLPGYWLSNVNLVADNWTKKWAKGLEVSLGIYNLFDQRFQQPGSRINWQDAFTQEGIAARLKMNYRF